MAQQRTSTLVLFSLVLCASATIEMATSQSFPPYECNRNPRFSRYRLDPAVNVSGIAVSGTRVCFTARVVPCGKPTAPCCSPTVDLAKIEMDVRPACKATIAGVTVNDSPAPLPTWVPYGTNDTRLTMKVTGLGLTADTAAGAVVCVQLGSQCPTLRRLCAYSGDTPRCVYALGKSGRGSCCPVGQSNLNKI